MNIHQILYENLLLLSNDEKINLLIKIYESSLCSSERSDYDYSKISLRANENVDIVLQTEKHYSNILVCLEYDQNKGEYQSMCRNKNGRDYDIETNIINSHIRSIRLKRLFI